VDARALASVAGVHKTRVRPATAAAIEAASLVHGCGFAAAEHAGPLDRRFVVISRELTSSAPHPAPLDLDPSGRR
jgi:hypothetical protein